MVALREVVFLAVFAALAVTTLATDVKQCPAASFENLSENVQLSPCKKVPCRLKKGHDQFIKITFIPDHDITDLTNHVTAEVLGANLPFFGVDGLSTCSKLTLENGDPAACPLKAGTKYTYSDSFPVLSIYPSISVKVHWELQDSTSKEAVSCFEVPVRIQ